MLLDLCFMSHMPHVLLHIWVARRALLLSIYGLHTAHFCPAYSPHSSSYFSISAHSA